MINLKKLTFEDIRKSFKLDDSLVLTQNDIVLSAPKD